MIKQSSRLGTFAFFKHCRRAEGWLKRQRERWPFTKRWTGFPFLPLHCWGFALYPFSATPHFNKVKKNGSRDNAKLSQISPAKGPAVLLECSLWWAGGETPGPELRWRRESFPSSRGSNDLNKIHSRPATDDVTATCHPSAQVSEGQPCLLSGMLPCLA